MRAKVTCIAIVWLALGYPAAIGGSEDQVELGERSVEDVQVVFNVEEVVFCFLKPALG